MKRNSSSQVAFERQSSWDCQGWGSIGEVPLDSHETCWSFWGGQKNNSPSFTGVGPDFFSHPVSPSSGCWWIKWWKRSWENFQQHPVSCFFQYCIIPSKLLSKNTWPQSTNNKKGTSFFSKNGFGLIWFQKKRSENIVPLEQNGVFFPWPPRLLPTIPQSLRKKKTENPRQWDMWLCRFWFVRMVVSRALLGCLEFSSKGFWTTPWQLGERTRVRVKCFLLEDYKRKHQQFSHESNWIRSISQTTDCYGCFEWKQEMLAPCSSCIPKIQQILRKYPAFLTDLLRVFQNLLPPSASL